MKKLVSLTLALMLALTMLAASAMAEEPPMGGQQNMRCGMLSMLNMTEEEYAVYKSARHLVAVQLVKEGYSDEAYSAMEVPGDPPFGPEDGQEPPADDNRPPRDGEDAPEPPAGDDRPPRDLEEIKDEIVYFDMLDAMLMALNAGDIDSIEIYQSVGKYLCATNDNLRLDMAFDLDKERGQFADLVFSGVLGNDFSFLMLEENAALRDQFNAAIADMKADGTMDKLVEEQITALIDGGEIAPIELPATDGAETVKVAVTGALPPMDYVAADGTPAGFNTAVLAEISRRAGYNIELVVVDSIGRASALASGTVDAVFWTRTSSLLNSVNAMTEEEQEANRIQIDPELTPEEIEAMYKLADMVNFGSYAVADMPEGTIATDPYYSDVFVPVELAQQ